MSSLEPAGRLAHTRDASRLSLDRIIDVQLLAEREGNIEALVVNMAQDIRFQVIGAWNVMIVSRDGVRRYYESWLSAVLPERVVQVSRLHWLGFALDETIWEGRVIGRVGAVEGQGRRISHRVLRLVEMRRGRIARELVWRDLEGLERQLGPPPRAGAGGP